MLPEVLRKSIYKAQADAEDSHGLVHFRHHVEDMSQIFSQITGLKIILLS